MSREGPFTLIFQDSEFVSSFPILEFSSESAGLVRILKAAPVPLEALRWGAAIGIFTRTSEVLLQSLAERPGNRLRLPGTPRTDGRLIEAMPAKKKAARKPAAKAPARKPAAKKAAAKKPASKNTGAKYEQSGAPWWKKFI
jgi:hypothetical protein